MGLDKFFSSLATGTHVLTARCYGEKSFGNCGKILNTSLIIALSVGLIVGVVGVLFAYDIADFFAADTKVGEYGGEYLFYRFMGIPLFLISVSYRGFYFGIGKTKVFMYSGILTNFLNIIFNYVFIFGAFGIKGMGLAGAGLGSSLATFSDVLFYLIYSSSKSHREKYGYFREFKLYKNYADEIRKLSLPVSFQNVFILVAFLSFVAITGLIGTKEQAASQLVISALFLSIMPCFGFGIAAQTLVGKSIGEKCEKKAKYLGYETSKLATIYTSVLGLLFVFAPKAILNIITDDASLIEAAVPIIKIAGFGQIFYAIGVVLANGLQSAGYSLYVMLADILVSWVLFLPLSYLFGVYLEWGIKGAWGALPIYVVLYSIAIYIKYYKSDFVKN